MKIKQAANRLKTHHAAKGKWISCVKQGIFHADTTPTHTVLLMSLNQ